VWLATYNVNSIRKRAPLLERFLKEEEPDLVLLQELKATAEQVPRAPFAALGYEMEVVGQKAYNGVAVLSRHPFRLRASVLPGLAPDLAAEARYIEIALEKGPGGPLIVGGLYAPNGNSGGEAGLARKRAWFTALARHAAALLAEEAPLILAGDFNVCPGADDAAPGALTPDDALIRPEVRADFRTLVWLGLWDAVRTLIPHGPAYTFWDYQGGAFAADRGLRIDHVLLAPPLTDRLQAVRIGKSWRAAEDPSDHVPVMVELAL